MPLSEIQNLFKETMLDHPRVLDDPDPALAAYFEEGDIPLPARLKVYRNNIVGSLTDIMAATFPVIVKLVGKEFFETMARSFILESPPRQGCLSLYGAGFDEFIKGYAPAKSLAYLPDIAKLEIAMNDAYYARDDQPLTAKDLEKIPPEKLPETTLTSRDSARFVESGFPLAAIRDFCQRENPEGTLNIDGGGARLMVLRPRLEVTITELDDDEWTMFKSLGGKNLGDALEETLAAHPDFDFQGFLQKHLALETFRRFA